MGNGRRCHIQPDALDAAAGPAPLKVPKLTKAEKLVQEQMLAIIEWASDRPGRWHDIGKLEATMKAVDLLEKRGVVEIRRLENQYRIVNKAR